MNTEKVFGLFLDGGCFFVKSSKEAESSLQGPTRMFRVSCSDDGRVWHVLCDDEVVFSGTKPDVEEWLDRQENRPAHRPTLNNPSRRRAGLHVAGLISSFFAAILARLRGR